MARTKHKRRLEINVEPMWLLDRFADHHGVTRAEVLEKAIRELTKDFIPAGELGRLPFRMWRRITINPDSRCWEWNADKCKAWYGHVYTGRDHKGKAGIALAHRVVYEILVGPIPHGLVLDHLCRHPQCVNPDHLEPVTSVENIRRGHGNGWKRYCKRGHEFTPENTLVVRPEGRSKQRKCRECARLYQKEYRQGNRNVVPSSGCQDAPSF